MRPPGALLAAGRDAEIFEYGPHAVLRRARSGRSLALEARTMAYVAAAGYPVPAVEEVSDDGSELVMERIVGPSMVAAIARRPWRVRRFGAMLGDLHRRLHELAAPPWLPAAGVGHGDAVVHLDLHPLNVMLGPRGPVVIDWSNARRGDPAVDVALAWALLSAGEVEARGPVALITGWARRVLTDGFLAAVDRGAAAAVLAAVVAWKCADPNMSAAEQAGMRRLAATVAPADPDPDPGR